MQHTEENLQTSRQQLDDLETEMNSEIEKATAGTNPQQLDVTKIEVHPRKSDIAIDKVVLVWRPVGK